MVSARNVLKRTILIWIYTMNRRGILNFTLINSSTDRAIQKMTALLPMECVKHLILYLQTGLIS
jgi:hypothetical protein